MGESFVYVIGPEVGPQKVGVAINVPRRLNELQIGCPLDLRVHHAETVDAEVAFKVEAIAHQKLVASRRRGEWYDVEPSTAVRAIKSALDDITHARAPARQRDTRDGLVLAYRRGVIEFRAVEAGLAYRKVRRLAAPEHDASTFSGNKETGWDAQQKRHLIEGEVVRHAGLESLKVLYRVAYRADPVGQDGEALASALEVVAKLLDKRAVAA